MLDEYQKLLKYLVTNSYSTEHQVVEPSYPDVTMVYSIKAWTFWHRDATKSHSDCPWEESLTKIETVRDIDGLWKSVDVLFFKHLLQK